MNLSQLESFLAVVETGSFTEAAFARGITQSAVSHAVQSLEQELGTPLVVRKRKGIEITPLGERVLVHVRAMVVHMDAITQEAMAERGQRGGRLRIGSIRSFVSPRILAAFVSHFRQRFPDIDLAIFEGTMREVATWIENGTIDVGFVMVPAEGLAATTVSRDELVVVVPRNHPLAQATSIAPSLLAGEDLVMESTECVLHVLHHAGVTGADTRLRIRYQASNSDTIFAMVREGIGSSILPRTMIPERDDGMVALPFDPPRHVQLGIAVRSEATASWAARQLVESAISWKWMRSQPLPV
ncbi:MAG: LysR family transcriptional regulator [Thermomicrobiales bacterium]